MQLFTKKLMLLSAFVFLYFQAVDAQKYTLDNVLTAKSRGTGAIIKDNTVTGYYSFYELEKKEKKTKTYQLNILDQNLSPLSSKKFSSQEDLTALEAAYNGNLLMIKFFDDKTDKFTLKSYNQNTEMVNSKSLDAKKVYDAYSNIKNEEEGESSTLFPIENKGFVHCVVKLRKGGTSHTYNEITFIPDGKDEKGWTWETSEKSEDFEWGDFMGVSGNTLLYLVNKREKLMSGDVEDFTLGIDINTGKKLFENSVEDRKYSVSTLNATPDENGGFMLFGLFFDKEAKTGKASSLGLFGFSVDATGKIVIRKYESWKKDVGKFLKVNDKGKIEDVGYIYFHKFIRTSDDKIFAIGEQYKTNVGASIATSLLMGGRSNTIVKVEDMYIFEFDKNFDLKDVQVFDKTKSVYNLSAIIGGGARGMGVYLQYLNCYDYTFTQMNKDKSKFSIGYVDYEKGKADKGWYFGSINYSGSKLTTDRVKFSSKATWYHVYPGKSGYVMIMEYFRKEKKLDFRMEKVNF